MAQDAITVTINGNAITAPRGTLLSGLLAHGHTYQPMPCGGRGTCGKCRVKVEGSVTPPTRAEMELLGTADLNAGIRLACMTYATGDCRITAFQGDISQICTQTRLPDGSSGLEDTLAVPIFKKYGVAIDIGTTTIAACLYDREWCMLAAKGMPNPQAAWGADVISRMEKALDGQANALSQQASGCLNELITSLSSLGSINTQEIDALVITGNTVMLHLLTETDVTPLTYAPFAAKRLFGEWITAADVQLHVLPPRTKVYLMPCISAFTGGDLVASLMACDFCHGDSSKLLADIGTNGEMALWHKEQLLVCSTAAGPAFEGVNISMGMVSGMGAIDRVSLCNGRLFPHVIGDIPAAGICGSGIVDAVACLLDGDTMDETGRLDCDPMPITPTVSLTQADIRNIQVAKSSIVSGLMTLMHEAAVAAADISSLYIAGGFGHYLDARNAGKIGLLPSDLVSRVKLLDNAALTGASMVLLDKSLTTVADKIAKQARCIDLATNPFFARVFVEEMGFNT